MAPWCSKCGVFASYWLFFNIIIHYVIINSARMFLFSIKSLAIHDALDAFAWQCLQTWYVHISADFPKCRLHSDHFKLILMPLLAILAHLIYTHLCWSSQAVPLQMCLTGIRLCVEGNSPDGGSKVRDWTIWKHWCSRWLPVTIIVFICTFI
jgi:hypothetical protein